MSSRDPRNANFEGMEAEEAPKGGKKGKGSKKGGKKGKKGRHFKQTEPIKKATLIMLMKNAEQGQEEEETGSTDGKEPVNQMKMLLEAEHAGGTHFTFTTKETTDRQHKYIQQTEVFPKPATPYARLHEDVDATLKDVYTRIMQNCINEAQKIKPNGKLTISATLGRTLYSNKTNIDVSYLLSGRILRPFDLIQALNNTDVGMEYDPEVRDGNVLPKFEGFNKENTCEIIHQLKSVTVPNLTSTYDLIFTQQGLGGEIRFTEAVNNQCMNTRVDCAAPGTSLPASRIRVNNITTTTEDEHVKKFVDSLHMTASGIFIPLEYCFNIGCYRVKSMADPEDPVVGVYTKGSLKVTVWKVTSRQTIRKRDFYYSEVAFVGLDTLNVSRGAELNVLKEELRDVGVKLLPCLVELFSMMGWGEASLTEEHEKQIWEERMVHRFTVMEKLNRGRENFALSFPDEESEPKKGEDPETPPEDEKTVAQQTEEPTPTTSSE
eukprot:TRINITY_DN553_c0_g4_i1.p1 TRINITY_DN553_c0_g4~~TRINITY_DN553_c0_g4_i1.p1  ORF type:complete len:491 (+),score=114.28 TRINITY_DN553_c0_g4_i1:1403-2875(+)